MRSRIGFIGFQMGHGGVGKDMINLMNALADTGVQVDILISTASSPDLSFLRRSINVIELGNGGRVARVHALVRYIRNVKPAAILSNKERDNEALVISQRITRSSTRAVIRVGTTNSEMLRRRHWWQRVPKRLAIKSVYQAADIIICVSKGVAEDTQQLTKVSPQKIHFLPNTTIPPDIDDRAMAPAEHPWFRSMDAPIILAVGRLARPKDYPTLLHAFKHLRKTRLCRLVILGEGKERKPLERLVYKLGINADVSMPGYVTNPYAFMKRAALFVLSSRWEGFGNVVAEALAIGTPVVSTDCRHGPREILDNGRFGALVAVGDADGLAKAMAETLDQPHPVEFLRQAADPYRIDRIIDRYRNVLLANEQMKR